MRMTRKLTKMTLELKELIIRKYTEEHQSATNIATDIGCCVNMVTDNLRRWGIPKIKRNMSMENHPQWKGGRVLSNEGYWDVRVSPDDFFYPMARSNNGYVREHRLIMAKYLNRRLLPWEVVHHKNGIKTDNRLENLQLLSSKKVHLPDTVSHSLITKLESKINNLELENEKLRNILHQLNYPGY
jgi:hypothetical protein